MVEKKIPLPRGVTMRRTPDGDHVRTGGGLREGEAYFSECHQTAIRFPLHPLIPTFLSFCGLAPMQVHPNVFRILAAVLFLNVTRGYGLGLAEVLYCYTLAACPGEDRFRLNPRDGRYLVQGLPDTDRGWKQEVVVVRGPWQCPVAGAPPVPTSFGDARRIDPNSCLSASRVRFVREVVLQAQPFFWGPDNFQWVGFDTSMSDAGELLARFASCRVPPVLTGAEASRAGSSSHRHDSGSRRRCRSPSTSPGRGKQEVVVEDDPDHWPTSSEEDEVSASLPAGPRAPTLAAAARAEEAELEGAILQLSTVQAERDELARTVTSLQTRIMADTVAMAQHEHNLDSWLWITFAQSYRQGWESALLPEGDPRRIHPDTIDRREGFIPGVYPEIPFQYRPRPRGV
ncbi:hypothetical protein QJS04_geneDACA021891 [Acorus gramineus]|uniref:Uncharacterized protein n=1 Tax=Acorus gramineus TaxID=55184 RepID=A0AAV9B9Z6_ACOGR|nr:hypothetical protein QJS04_geneDACA021891 [Acorus gramineus]